MRKSVKKEMPIAPDTVTATGYPSYEGDSEAIEAADWPFEGTVVEMYGSDLPKERPKKISTLGAGKTTPEAYKQYGEGGVGQQRSGTFSGVPIKYWSHSSLMSYLRNPLAWYKRYVEKIYDMPSGPAAIIGRAGHVCLQHFYGGLKKEGAVELGME